MHGAVSAKFASQAAIMLMDAFSQIYVRDASGGQTLHETDLSWQWLIHAYDAGQNRFQGRGGFLDFESLLEALAGEWAHSQLFFFGQV